MSQLVIVNPEVKHAAGMWEVAKQIGLDLNSSYSYLMMSEFFSETCVVCVDRITDHVVGFVTGFQFKKTPDSLFIWQNP